MDNTKIIDQLNSFLRGEMAAVETYRDALTKISDLRERRELEECMRSHDRRVQMLRDRILELGGTPADSSGPWGTFANAVEGSARLFGDKAAIAALEEGEDHGLKDYRTDLGKLDQRSRDL